MGLLTVFTLLLAVGCGHDVEDNLAQPRIRTIIGGTNETSDTEVAKHTLFVVSRRGRMSWSCSGTLINSSTIMTAGHCVEGAKSFEVRFGPNAASPQAILVASNPRLYPGFSSSSNRSRSTIPDVAFLSVNTSIPAGYQPSLFLADTLLLSRDDKLTLSGYGLNRYSPATGLGSGLGQLRSVRAPFAGFFDVFLRYYATIAPGKTTCFGDSGGPDFVNYFGKIYQVGVHSATDSCRSLNKSTAIGPAVLGWLRREGVTVDSLPGVTFVAPRNTARSSYFGSRGYAVLPASPKDDFATGVALDSKNGDLVVVGPAHASRRDYDFGVIRMKYDSALDKSFAGGRGATSFSLTNRDNKPERVVIDTQGRIVIVGSVQENDSDSYRMVVARLLRDGAMDASFNFTGSKIITRGRMSFAYDVAIQRDGKIIIAGALDEGRGDTDIAVVRLLHDGSFDPAFGGGTGISTIAVTNRNNLAYAVKIQTDGKIVYAGLAQQRVGRSDQNLAVVGRLLSDGSVDKRFGTKGAIKFLFSGRASQANAIAFQGSKIIVAGIGENLQRRNWDYAAARLNSNGTLDKTFGKEGAVSVSMPGVRRNNHCKAVVVLASGLIVLGGHYDDPVRGDNDIGLIGLGRDGKINPIFGDRGFARLSITSRNHLLHGMALDGTGRKIVIVGARQHPPTDHFDFLVARFDARTGRLDGWQR